MASLNEAYNGNLMSYDVNLTNGKIIKVRKVDLKFLRIQSKDDGFLTYYSDLYKLFIRVPYNNSKIYGYTKQEMLNSDLDYMVKYVY
jgi:hypothetical protein